MQLFIIFLSLVVALAGATDVSENARAPPSGNLIPILEGYIKFLKDNGTFDPFNLGQRHFVVDDKNLDINLDVNLEGFIRGLLDVTLNKFNMNILSQFTLDIEFPSEIHLDLTSYKFDGSLGLIKIFGDGKLSVKLGEIKVTGNGNFERRKLGNKTYLAIRKITPNLSVKQFEFELTGYLNDDDRSAMMTKMINNMAPILFQQYFAIVNDALAKFLVAVTDKFPIPSPA